MDKTKQNRYIPLILIGVILVALLGLFILEWEYRPASDIDLMTEENIDSTETTLPQPGDIPAGIPPGEETNDADINQTDELLNDLDSQELDSSVISEQNLSI